MKIIWHDFDTQHSRRVKKNLSDYYGRRRRSMTFRCYQFINFVLASHFVTAIWLIKIKFKNTCRNWLEADSSTSMNCTCHDNKFISRVYFSLWHFYGFHLLSHRVYKRFFCSKYINWTLERSSSCLSTLWYSSIVAYKKIVPH